MDVRWKRFLVHAGLPFVLVVFQIYFFSTMLVRDDNVWNGFMFMGAIGSSVLIVLMAFYFEWLFDKCFKKH